MTATAFAPATFQTFQLISGWNTQRHLWILFPRIKLLGFGSNHLEKKRDLEMFDRLISEARSHHVGIAFYRKGSRDSFTVFEITGRDSYDVVGTVNRRFLDVIIANERSKYHSDVYDMNERKLISEMKAL
jgi:hypothetical protein